MPIRKSELPLPVVRCLTRLQAARYLGVGITLFDTLGVPCIRLGRRCVYDRVDLDAWLDEYKGQMHATGSIGVSINRTTLASGDLGVSGSLDRHSTARAYAK